MERTLHLTRRELEILRLIAAGLPQPTIAAMLFISLRTVETHIQHMLRRWDAHNACQLVYIATKARLI